MNRNEIITNELAVYRKTGEIVFIGYVDSKGFVGFRRTREEIWPLSEWEYGNNGRPEDFDILPLETISAEDFGKLVRAEAKCEDLLESHSFIPLFKIEGEYKNAAEDLLQGLKKLLEESWGVKEFLRWFKIIMMNYSVIGYDEEFEFRSIRTLHEEDLLYSVVLDLQSEYDYYGSFDEELDTECIEESVETLKMLLSNRGKDVREWQIPEEMLRFYVLNHDNDEFKYWSDEERETYRFFLEKLAESELMALEKMGYLIYTGDTIYEQDWNRCRNIFEKYYSLTGDANAMNTLGYIYYYGRCNNGTGEYEKAFRCFSVGHAHGLYESTYKLGDMFRHGYGVVKSEETAKNLYWMVYNDSIKSFLKGDYRGQFADAALRIGNVYKNGIGDHQNDCLALYYYLQADYAIRKRMEARDYYGDAKVFSGIQKSLNELIGEKELPKTIIRDYPFALREITEVQRGRRIRVAVRSYNDGSLGLSAKYLPFPEEGLQDIPKMFLTYENEGYCALLEKVKLKTDQKARIEVMGGSGSFVYNCIKHSNKNEWLFYHDETLTAVLNAENFTMSIPSKKKKNMETICKTKA